MIQTENNYDRDVFNGDLGVVENMNRIKQEMIVSFEDRPVKYDFLLIWTSCRWRMSCPFTKVSVQSSRAS